MDRLAVKEVRKSGVPSSPARCCPHVMAVVCAVGRPTPPAALCPCPKPDAGRLLNPLAGSAHREPTGRPAAAPRSTLPRPLPAAPAAWCSSHLQVAACGPEVVSRTSLAPRAASPLQGLGAAPLLGRLSACQTCACRPCATDPQWSVVPIWHVCTSLVCKVRWPVYEVNMYMCSSLAQRA